MLSMKCVRFTLLEIQKGTRTDQAKVTKAHMLWKQSCQTKQLFLSAYFLFSNQHFLMRSGFKYNTIKYDFSPKFLLSLCQWNNITWTSTYFLHWWRMLSLDTLTSAMLYRPHVIWVLERHKINLFITLAGVRHINVFYITLAKWNFWPRVNHDKF